MKIKNFVWKSFYTMAILLISHSMLSAQNTVGTLASEDEIKTDIALAPCKNADRLESVKRLFQKMGAKDSDINVEKLNDTQNIIVTKKGKTDEIVIVSAHYDKVKDGCGAIDNWTGIVLIAEIYRTVRDIPTDKTILFIAFDKEEIGLLGSKAMAKEILKENRKNYCSVINLDSFGFGYPQILDNVSNSKMTSFAETLAKELNMPFSHASLAGTADADSSSFVNKNIPAVTFHGLNNKWQEFLHSNKDKVENINLSSVYIAYQYILQYLKRIDAGGCDIFRK